MDVMAIGRAGLSGWRRRVGDAAAGPVSRVTPLDQEQVRSLVGLAFLALSAYYVASALARAARRRPR